MMNVWGMTDVGLIRSENQDAYAVRAEDGFTVCVVCDGMGGPGGRLASSWPWTPSSPPAWPISGRT